MWVVTGDLDGVPVKVSFDGELQADKHTMRVLTEYADLVGVVGTTPVGPWLSADLSDESAAFLLTKEVLMHVEVIAGEIPPLPEAVAVEVKDA